VLVLRAGDAEIGVLRARGVELGLRLGDGFFAIDACFIERFGEIERVLIGLDGLIEQLFLCVLRAEIVIVNGNFGLCSEPYILKIGSRRLCG